MQFNRCFGCMEETKGYPCPHCGFDPRAQQDNYVLPCGTVLSGHYVVGKVLGQGGFGITYIGYDLSLQRRVAIKEFYPKGQASRFIAMGSSLQWASDGVSQTVRTTGMDSFLREARKMAKVEDIPEVVGVRESFLENDTAYIIMDYIEGKTLLSVLKEKGPMPWEKAKDIFLPAISAMEKVHQAGLVHRDLSPDNLMLTAKGVRILDLGAAKDLSSGSGASSAQVAKGGYSPMEQYTQRGGSGPWSDVYAMAATIYYTLTGVLPPNAIDRMEKDNLDWKLLSQRGVPANVISALQKAMTVSAKSRTQSMAEFLGQLQKGSAPRKRESKRTAVIAAVAAVVVVLGIALGFAVNAKKKPAAPAMALPPETQAVETTVPQKPTVPETTLPPETQPVPVHVMAAEKYPWQVDNYKRNNLPFWGQTAYKRGDVKTVTFRGSLEGVPADAQDVSQARDRSVLAWMEDGNLTVAAEGKIAPNPNVSYMFSIFENVTAIDFGGCFDTSNVTNMGQMFYRCGNLAILDLSGFDTANVTNMGEMFCGCSSLTELDVSGFDTTNVYNMGWMFANCGSLTELDVSGFDTANVAYMGGMFCGCSSLTVLDVSGLDTANVAYMGEMFRDCSSLTGLDVSGFDTANVTNMGEMFRSCSSLTALDVSGFDTANVANMNSMFFGCSSLKSLDLSSWNANRVSDIFDMFKGCDQLTDLKCSDTRIQSAYKWR